MKIKLYTVIFDPDYDQASVVSHHLSIESANKAVADFKSEPKNQEDDYGVYVSEVEIDTDMFFKEISPTQTKPS